MLEKLLIRQIFNQFGHLYNLKIITSLSEPEQNVDIVISTSAMGEHSNLKNQRSYSLFILSSREGNRGH